MQNDETQIENPVINSTPNKIFFYVTFFNDFKITLCVCVCVCVCVLERDKVT